jgi:16S rRNA (guanine527-N7)-methyltransferase
VDTPSRSFADELTDLLPADLPNRDACIAGAALHLERIVEENKKFNLTRIVGAREAAIKHVLDSVMPWRLFAGAKHVADAGSGAGFPGIPLALVLPETRFTLLESTQKKAIFLQSTVRALKLENVEAFPERAETWLTSQPSVRLVTARALAPLSRAIPLFAPSLRRGVRFLLYKGPDAENEIVVAQQDPATRKWPARIVQSYELSDGAGSRRIVEIG